MKFALAFVLSVSAFSAMADHILSSKAEIISVDQACHRDMSGRNSNLGISKLCFNYSVKKTQTKILTDADGKGFPVPGAKPYTVKSILKKQSCKFGSMGNNDAEDSCEAARQAIADHIN